MLHALQLAKEAFQIIMSCLGVLLARWGEHPPLKFAELEEIFVIRSMRLARFFLACLDELLGGGDKEILLIQYRIGNRAHRADCANRIPIQGYLPVL